MEKITLEAKLSSIKYKRFNIVIWMVSVEDENLFVRSDFNYILTLYSGMMLLLEQ